MTEAIALTATLLSLTVMVCCAAVVYTCATVYIPDDWSRMRDELLEQLLTDHFGYRRGLEMTIRRSRKISDLLSGRRRQQRARGRGSEPGGDPDILLRSVLRLRRAAAREQEIQKVRRHAEALATRELRWLADQGRGLRSVDELLMLWRPLCGVATGRLVAVGASRQLAPVAMNLGARAATMAGLLGIVGVVGGLATYYVRAGGSTGSALRHLLDLVGSWMAAGAILGVIVVLGVEVRRVQRDVFQAWAIPRRRQVLGLAVMGTFLVVAAATHTFAWQEKVANWQLRLGDAMVSSMPERWMTAAGAVLTAGILAGAVINGIRVAVRKDLVRTERVEGLGVSIVLLLTVGLAGVALMRPGGLAFRALTYALVAAVLISVAALLVAHALAHRRRLHGLAAAGSRVPRNCYRPWILCAAVLVLAFIDAAIELVTMIPTVHVVMSALAFALTVQIALLSIGAFVAVIFQVMAFIRYYLRVRNAAELALQPSATKAVH